jgi:hypothetical protein
MESDQNIIEPLLERAEQYGKTSFNLLKLKSVAKTADITSALASRLLLVVILSLFALTLNIAIGLWLGDLIGKSYYGFLIVALFYGVIGIIVFFSHSKIKARINDLVITQVLN